MQKKSEDRVRWQMIKHLYILTTPDCLLFSYQSLSETNPFEKHVIKLLNPIQINNHEIRFDVDKEYEKFLNPNGSLDFSSVPRKFFIEKLSTLVGNQLDNTVALIEQNTRNFGNGKGFEINLGTFFIL